MTGEAQACRHRSGTHRRKKRAHITGKQKHVPDSEREEGRRKRRAVTRKRGRFLGEGLLLLLSRQCLRVCGLCVYVCLPLALGLIKKMIRMSSAS
jgi:hypothetical protein